MKKIVSLLLAVLLVVSALPIAAFAAEDGASDTQLSDLEFPENPSSDDGDPGSEPEPSPEPEPKQYQLETTEHRAYIHGDGDTFRPEYNLTRAEASVIIYSLLTEKPEPSSFAFSDVPADAWYARFVNPLGAADILHGYGNNEFHPNDYIKRSEFLTIVCQFYDLKETDKTFPDVPTDYWGYRFVATGLANGWISGFDDGLFRPESLITRAQAVSILNRVLGRRADGIKAAPGAILKFVDLPYSHWAYSQIMEASVEHTYTKSDSGLESWTTYDIGQSARQPGMYTINNELYCVDGDRHFVHNESVGVLYFNNSGRYTSKDAALDVQIKRIVQAQTVSGDSAIDNLRRLYRYVCDHYEYLARPYIDVGSTGWEVSWTKEMLARGKGSCYSFAALFTMLARQMGYQATGISGWCMLPQWNGWSRHGWTQIALDGQIYVCDPESEGVYLKNQGWDWDLFMKKYGETRYSYRVTDTVLHS